MSKISGTPIQIEALRIFNIVKINACKKSRLLPVMITALLIVSTMAVFLPVTSAQAKQDATLTLSASNTSVTANDNITLIGTLSAPRNGTVTLFWSYNCYCFNYGDSLIMTNGEFSTDFTADSTGFYAFKVIWGERQRV
jgi:hypothetical protein